MNRREEMYANKSRVFGKNRITKNNQAIQHQKRTDQRMVLHENCRGNINALSLTPKKANDGNDKENNENHDVAAATATPKSNTLSKLERQQLYLKRFVEWKQQKKLNQAAKERQQPILPGMVKSKALVKNKTENDGKSTTTTKSNTRERRSVYELKTTPIAKPATETSNVASKSKTTAAAAAVVQRKKVDVSTSAKNKSKLQENKDTNVAAITATTTTTENKVANLKTSGCDGGKIVSNFVGRGAAAKAHKMMERKKPATPKSNTAKLGINLKAKQLQATSMAAHVKRIKKQDIEKVSNDAVFKNRTEAIKKIYNEKNNNNNAKETNIIKKPIQRTETLKKNDMVNMTKMTGIKGPSSKVLPKINITTAAPTKAILKPITNEINNLKLTKQKQPQHMEDAGAIQTPLEVLRSSGKFDPTVTSTQERGSMHFDFESACAATNAFTNTINNKNILTSKCTPAASKHNNVNSAQRKLLGHYSIDVDFIRNDSVYGADAGFEPDEDEHTKINEKSFESAEVTVKPVKDMLTEEKSRTIEAVRYFRQQLALEIIRLHKLCHDWTTYRDANLKELQIKCADDMINVTIGQTKLLTSKKFQQFNGLIDRCEAGVTGTNALINDGSEDTKPITAIDLEGFWSVVQLQVENVDIRFANLEKWKLNEWKEPEAVKVVVPGIKPKLVQKKTITKNTELAAKAKSKGSSALRGMIRQKQAEMRKKKDTSANISKKSILVVLTPTKKSIKPQQTNSANKGNPRRLVLVKDRKQFSHSPTILLMPAKSNNNKSKNNNSRKPSPCKIRRISLSGQSSAKKEVQCVREPKENSNKRPSNSDTAASQTHNLLRAALKGATEQRKSLTPLRANVASTPIQLKSTPKRKSILKTPGTDQRSTMKRQVSFNFSAVLNSIQFVNDSSDMETDEE